MTLREPPNCLNYSPTVWSGTLKASCKLKPFLASRQKTNHLTLRRLLSLRGLVKDPEGTKNGSSLLVQSGFSLTPSSFSWMIPMAVLTVQQFKWEELIYQCAFNEEHPRYLTLTWRQTRDWDHRKDSSAENSSLIIKQASFFPFFCPSPPLHHPQLRSTPLPSSLHVVFLSSSARVAQFDCLEDKGDRPLRWSRDFQPATSKIWIQVSILRWFATTCCFCLSALWCCVTDWTL